MLLFFKLYILEKVNSKIFLLFSLKAAFTPELVSHLVSNLEFVKYNILLFFSCFVFFLNLAFFLELEHEMDSTY